jgi:hypothetical protein
MDRQTNPPLALKMHLPHCIIHSRLTGTIRPRRDRTLHITNTAQGTRNQDELWSLGLGEKGLQVLEKEDRADGVDLKVLTEGREGGGEDGKKGGWGSGTGIGDQRVDMRDAVGGCDGGGKGGSARGVGRGEGENDEGGVCSSGERFEIRGRGLQGPNCGYHCRVGAQEERGCQAQADS